jgi:hypothetical protein
MGVLYSYESQILIVQCLSVLPSSHTGIKHSLHICIQVQVLLLTLIRTLHTSASLQFSQQSAHSQMQRLSEVVRGVSESFCLIQDIFQE